jgi:hypothetical protein
MRLFSQPLDGRTASHTEEGPWEVYRGLPPRLSLLSDGAQSESIAPQEEVQGVPIGRSTPGPPVTP